MPGNDLIGNGFKNPIVFLHDVDPVGDGSGEFKINLHEPAVLKTSFIVNFCERWLDYEFRYYIGLSEMRVGYNRMDFSEDNPVVASGITDGGFRNLQLTRGDVVTFRRNGANPYDGNPDLSLN